jgi:hypothetical protein
MTPKPDTAPDPRDAETLDEASLNPDGTHNGARAISWLSHALTGGKGLAPEEVQAIWQREKAKRAKQGQPDKP